MNKLKHVLGISGGKDSAALAIYLHDHFPELEIEYYFTDTGKELDETYELISKLDNYLGKPIKKLVAKEAALNPTTEPFDHFLKMYRGYLPSSTARWCTKKLKLEPFENFVGDIPTISYVGIRNDENREGYISKKSTIQSIFPFRRNIWSEDLTKALLSEKNVTELMALYEKHVNGKKLDRINLVLNAEYSNKLAKVDELLDQGIVEFNLVTFEWLKSKNYPLALQEDFPLLYKDEVFVREDIFQMLRDSGVGVPGYYNKINYDVNGQKGAYSRSRSGCYFCFFQQKIEWVWLYEQHPDLFKKAMSYEDPDNGFTWNQTESLEDLIDPNRIASIKEEHFIRQNRKLEKNKSKNLLDILSEEDDGCVACFV